MDARTSRPAASTIVVYEGIDCAGKTSQIDLVSGALVNRGISVLRTGVFATEFGQRVRSWLVGDEELPPISHLSQLFLLASAMCQVLEEIHASDASVILVDRFVYSTMAYHGGGLGVGVAMVQEVFQPVLRRFHPDVVVYLDLPVEEAASRRAAGDRIERMDASFYARVRDGYREALRGLDTLIEIDARQTKTTILERTLQAILASVARRSSD